MFFHVEIPMIEFTALISNTIRYTTVLPGYQHLADCAGALVGVAKGKTIIRMDNCINSKFLHQKLKFSKSSRRTETNDDSAAAATNRIAPYPIHILPGHFSSRLIS